VVNRVRPRSPRCA